MSTPFMSVYFEVYSILKSNNTVIL